MITKYQKVENFLKIKDAYGSVISIKKVTNYQQILKKADRLYRLKDKYTVPSYLTSSAYLSSI